VVSTTCICSTSANFVELGRTLLGVGPVQGGPDCGTAVTFERGKRHGNGHAASAPENVGKRKTHSKGRVNAWKNRIRSAFWRVYSGRFASL
jgi:hypothetical protein